jgi:large subunit ribosomal protein L4
MKVDVLDLKGKKVREMELPANIFEAPVNIDLMHQAYTRQMANARLGTHETKTRSYVRGGGRKPFKQKGTGRARQGSTNAAQWVGGGRIHTPHPHGYGQRMPKKMRQAALRSVLSAKAADSGIVVVDDFDIKEPKTRQMAETLTNWVGASTALVLMPVKDQNYENVMRSTGNIESAKIMLASYLNVRDVLNFQKVVLPVKTIDALVAHLG